MKNILVVDDSDVDRLLMSGLLGRSSKFSVIIAENGAQALTKLEEWPIDIVLTDLQMPKMDGLQLVKKIREMKLEIPVILTTGAGSEEVAAQALLAGASGYIPKAKLNLMLIPTITEVLEIFNRKKGSGRLVKRTKLSRHEIVIENDPSLIPLLVDFCEQILASSSPLDRIDRLRIAIAVDQAVQNAMFRGNLEIDSDYTVQGLGNPRNEDDVPMFIQQRFEEEPYVSRRVKVLIEIKPSRFAIRISDGGPGFDTSEIGDLSELATRGTNLMNSFMDSVEYNKAGNEVLMKYRFSRKAAAGEPAEKEKAVVSGVGRIVCQTTGNSHDISVQKFVIGSGKAAHLNLQGKGILRLHCMLVSDNEKVKVINLSPEGKTLVNGKAQKGAVLRADDLISLGEHTLKFETA